MTLIVDERQRGCSAIYRAADRIMDLEYSRDDQPDESFYYDIHLICDSARATRKHGTIKEYTFCRKPWPEFVSSWVDNTLEYDLEPVDALIVEYNPVTIAEDVPKRMSDEPENTYRLRCMDYFRMQRAALKHLATISANMWVITSGGPDETIDILRSIEGNPNIEVQPHPISGVRLDVASRLLRALPRINPDRELPDGKTLRDLIWPLVDKEKLVEALNLKEWVHIDFQGQRGIGIADLGAIADSLRGERNGA